MKSDAAAADRPLVTAWAVTLVALLAATWRLWTPFRETPLVAPTAWLALAPRVADLLLLAGLAVHAVAVAITSGSAGRRPIVIATACLGALMALDQLRWQPWAWHAVLAGVILTTASGAAAVARLRWVAIAVYAFSAVAKLDAEFAATLGGQMLGVFGVPEAWRSRLAPSLPIGELALAGLLAASLRWRRLAWPACGVAAAMHAVTFFVLSPWGLGHSLGVLVWNAGFAWQTVVLFRPREVVEEAPARSRRSWIASAACAAGVALPLLTPLGLWDQWPGWALYAPGGPRASLYVEQASASSLPRSLRSHVGESDDPLSPWRPVALDAWVLAETGAPIYPQPRVVAALATGFAERGELDGQLLLVTESAAGRFTRQRTAIETREREAISEAAKLGGLRPGVAWNRR